MTLSVLKVQHGPQALAAINTHLSQHTKVDVHMCAGQQSNVITPL